MLSIPGSSCECERLFSELGDLLEPRRRSISPQLLAAIQCDRRWIRARFGSGEVPVKEAISDEEMDAKYANPSEPSELLASAQLAEQANWLSSLSLLIDICGENSWVDKPEWLTSANAGFLQLWQSYKPQRTRPLSQTTAKPRHRGIDDVIGALVRRNKAQVEAAHDDEYERWRTQEPEWTSEQYLSDGHPVKYWIQLRSKYPCLSQFAIDILTIPASSCDCERLFSELGDLLEPRRRALGSELLAALQLVRSWRRAGFDGLYNNGDDEDKWSDVKDEEIVQQYDIEGWSTTP
ncbi:Dimer-Tnp-hAT dimerization containing protein [Pyrenophora tritici-repentis]|uniref:Dimer-Tnp-hAT dimerization containing protein n=1 Tax=Pyrenophora tritici-repentis TaxID=45151 RepID=A0A922N274_9PLEO|nr:Dimer-Tnp-hAT dimerization containing protein [Pyrenophora tritici-repentis]